MVYALLTVGGLMFAFPLFWTFSSSLQTWHELRSYEPHLLPAVPQWQNYVDVFGDVPFGRWIGNSFLLIAIVVPGTLVTSTLAAYAFARFDFVGKDFWFILCLSTMMLPFYVTLIPQYILFFNLGLVNTYVPLTIGAWLGGGAFNIFLMRQFIMTIPRDLDEAAVIDGAGPFRILWQVLVPLLKPALITVGVLQFIGQWNNFFGPFIYLNDVALFPVAVGLNFFKNFAYEVLEPRDHLLMAGTALMTIPVITLFAVAQRYFIQGVVMTGLKL
ncbi:MAG: carbohydrate ABC transporter permease [Anaerolineae bacterium]